MNQQAVCRVPGDDDRATELAAIGKGPFLHVQAQAPLARLLVRP